MLKNYLTIALRNILRHKTYSFINITGLAVGMAAFILILLFVGHELSYDRFHVKAERIYRLLRVSEIRGKSDTGYHLPAPLLPYLAQEFPEVVSFVRVERLGKTSVTYQEQSFVEDQFILADPAFFQVFTFPLVRGNPDAVLNDKYSVVITENTAVKYFGKEDPLGKTLTLDNRLDLIVTGVAQDVPHNTDIPFTLVAPFPLVNDLAGGYDYLSSWGAFNFPAYVFTQPQISLAEFEQKSGPFCRQFRPNDSPDYQPLKSLALQPLTAIHLTSDLKLYILIFTAIGVIILGLACINFMNLAVAQSASRSKEVGMRKAVGATRFQVMAQFFGEAIVLSLVTLPLAIVMVEIFLPMYNSLFNLHLDIQYIRQWPLSLGMVGIALLVGIISGAYPAWYISAKQPANILRPSLALGTARSPLRNILVVFQFSAAIILLTMTMVIHSQLNFIQQKNLGFNKEHIINVTLYDTGLRQQWNVLKTELLTNPDILSVSGNHFMTSEWNNSIQWEGMRDDEQMQMRFFLADADFLPTFQAQLLSGRNFRKDSPADQGKAYLLNESAVEALGWERESSVGKQFRVLMAGNELGSVVGIVKDFHFQSLRDLLKPLAIEMGTSFNVLSIKVRPDDIQQTIDFIRNTMSDISPQAPFEYYFVEDDIGQMYTLEEQLGQIFRYFSGLSILIACLGLFGLSAFTTERRTKEIGIRKALGASVPQIVGMLSREFLVLVLVASVIAWPVAWYAMSRWLQDFAYRISLGIGTFVLAGTLALVIALATVSYQAIKAALANPVDALRYE